MIFVTVGTHEQPFDRLIKEIDRLAGANIIAEKVVIQTGYSSFVPKHCESRQMYPHEEMLKNMEDARIIISHGGPSSFMTALSLGKIPIVVPRQHKFGEHVNDHQMYFSQKVEKEMKNIIVVKDIAKLAEIIQNYDEIVNRKKTRTICNNERFCEKFAKLMEE